MEDGRINWDEGNSVLSIAFIGNYFERFIVCRVIRGNIGVLIALLMLDGMHSFRLYREVSTP